MCLDVERSAACLPTAQMVYLGVPFVAQKVVYFNEVRAVSFLFCFVYGVCCLAPNHAGRAVLM